jgi:hypothetical protein
MNRKILMVVSYHEARRIAGDIVNRSF